MTDDRASAAIRSSTLGTDGQGFKELVKAGLIWLQHHQEAINSLNVYPVPDGDTGTNMVLTMESAWAEIKDSPERQVCKVAHQMSHGALMGARGNSGVILSQIWRGFARGLDDLKVYRARDLAMACQEAAATAYKGVVKPVEGTILTVVRAVADAATEAVEETNDLIRILERMVFAAHETVLLTPSLLPVLKEAGVVDAGGQGLFVILEGMLRHLRGDSVARDVQLSQTVDLISADMPADEIGYGYDVQFLIVGQDLDVVAVRQKVAAMGECPLVVGDPKTVKVHVHVPDPGVPISFGASLGSLRDVVVEDMQAQYHDFIVEQDMPLSPYPAAPAVNGIGVVAVVMGEGLAQVFQSLGVTSVVHGGQTMNPSTQDLLAAIQAVPADEVIVLPNNGNIILAAEQACELAHKSAVVVPTKTIPQGITALMSINYQADFESNVSAMKAAMGDVESGEVTVATRTATIDGVAVADGQVIGLHNGQLKAVGNEVDEVVQALLQVMDASAGEIITLYFGEDVAGDEAQALADHLQQFWAEQSVEVIEGGQPHYYYFISVE